MGIWERCSRIVISNDAVHYGDLEWGDSKNMAPMGTDSIGTKMAREMDKKIINECLTTFQIKK